MVVNFNLDSHMFVTYIRMSNYLGITQVSYVVHFSIIFLKFFNFGVTWYLIYLILNTFAVDHKINLCAEYPRIRAQQIPLYVWIYRKHLSYGVILNFDLYFCPPFAYLYGYFPMLI